MKKTPASAPFIIEMKIDDPFLWECIKQGQVTGFSMGGSALVEPRLKWWQRLWRWLCKAAGVQA